MRNQGRSQNNGEVYAQAVSAKGLGHLRTPVGSEHSVGKGSGIGVKLYNRTGDVFDHSGSSFSNIKFRLFCPFMTIPLRTN